MHVDLDMVSWTCYECRIEFKSSIVYADGEFRTYHLQCEKCGPLMYATIKETKQKDKSPRGTPPPSQGKSVINIEKLGQALTKLADLFEEETRTTHEQDANLMSLRIIGQALIESLKED